MSSEFPATVFTFEDVLVSLSSYSHIGDVPGKFFKTTLEIMRTDHVSRSAACERMADILSASREAVSVKLKAYDRSEPISNAHPSRRDLMRISRF